MAGRATQVGADVLRIGEPQARVTLAGAEVLYLRTQPAVATQVGVEVLYVPAPVTPTARTRCWVTFIG